MSYGMGVWGRYKEHFVCFKCRKMFRQASFPEREVAFQVRFKDYQDFILHYKAPCPECNQPMPNMGKGFRPPKKKEVERWRELEIAARQGVSFSGFRW